MRTIRGTSTHCQYFSSCRQSSVGLDFRLVWYFFSSISLALLLDNSTERRETRNKERREKKKYIKVNKYMSKQVSFTIWSVVKRKFVAAQLSLNECFNAWRHRLCVDRYIMTFSMYALMGYCNCFGFGCIALNHPAFVSEKTLRYRVKGAWQRIVISEAPFPSPFRYMATSNLLKGPRSVLPDVVITTTLWGMGAFVS